LLQQFDWTPLSALVLNAAVYTVTIPLSWRYRSSAPPRKFLRTRYDSPLRALAAATVVVIVTTASHSIGSFASGMFALFPIVFCSSIVILHPRVGGKATASVMAHAQVALIGLTLGFLAVHYFAEPLGAWPALAIGLGVAVAWSGMLLVVRSGLLKRA
jgi:FtsH-binding integral membrane protein